MATNQLKMAKWLYDEYSICPIKRRKSVKLNRLSRHDRKQLRQLAGGYWGKPFDSRFPSLLIAGPIAGR